MVNYGIMSGSKLNEWSGKADVCVDNLEKQYKKLDDIRKNVKNNFDFTYDMGTNCESLYNSAKQFVGSDGKPIATGMDLEKGPNNILLAMTNGPADPPMTPDQLSEKQKFFHADTPFTLMNQGVYSSLMYKYFWYNYTEDILYLYNKGIPLKILNGHWDGVCNPMFTQEFLRTDDDIRKNWDAAHWTTTKNGKMISFKNFSYELVFDSGHCVGFIHPDLITEKIAELLQE